MTATRFYVTRIEAKGREYQPSQAVRLLRQLRDADGGSIPLEVKGSRFYVRAVKDSGSWFSFELWYAINRRILTDTERVAEGTRDIREYGTGQVYVLPRSALVLFEHPRVDVRDSRFTPAKIRDAAQHAVQSQLQRIEPGLRLVVPVGTRDRDFFISTTKSAAAAEDVRIIEVRATELSGRPLADASELTLYNPDYDWETVGRRFMPTALRGVSSVDITADRVGDLAHNPIARGIIGSGAVTRLVVEKQGESDHNQIVVYTPKIKNEVDVEGRPEDEDFPAHLFEALRRSGYPVDDPE